MRAEPDHVLRSLAEPAALERVHDLLERVWTRHPDVADEDRMRFELAVTEIAGNIIEHTGTPWAVEFHLGVVVHPDRLEARFRDAGRRMEADFSSATMPVAMAESGRGLALAMAVSDELTYRNDGADNHWLIVRRRTTS